MLGPIFTAGDIINSMSLINPRLVPASFPTAVEYGHTVDVIEQRTQADMCCKNSEREADRCATERYSLQIRYSLTGKAVSVTK